MQIWKEYRKACFRKSNSSADLCEEAFYTYPSRIFNSSWANNYQLHMRHFTFVETEKYRKRKKKYRQILVSPLVSPLCLKEKPTKLLIELYSQQYNLISSWLSSSNFKKTPWNSEGAGDVLLSQRIFNRLTGPQQNPSFCYSENFTEKENLEWKMLVKIANLKCNNNKLDNSTMDYVQLQKSRKNAQTNGKKEWGYESLAS